MRSCSGRTACFMTPRRAAATGSSPAIAISKAGLREDSVGNDRVANDPVVVGIGKEVPVALDRDTLWVVETPGTFSGHPVAQHAEQGSAVGTVGIYQQDAVRVLVGDDEATESIDVEITGAGETEFRMVENLQAGKVGLRI